MVENKNIENEKNIKDSNETNVKKTNLNLTSQFKKILLQRKEDAKKKLERQEKLKLEIAKNTKDLNNIDKNMYTQLGERLFQISEECPTFLEDFYLLLNKYQNNTKSGD